MKTDGWTTQKHYLYSEIPLCLSLNQNHLPVWCLHPLLAPEIARGHQQAASFEKFPLFLLKQ